MSYSVTPYVVDLADLNRRIAARDVTLLDGIESEAQDLDDDLDDETPSTVEHGRRIVLGQAENEGSNAKYGYALMLICARMGTWQQNDEWAAIAGLGKWLETIDEALAKAGCQVSIGTDIIHTGPPITIPWPDDFPTIGHVLPGRISTLLGELANALPSLPPAERRAVAQVVDWLKAARDRGLVLFEC
jgi:hypothetical protein